MGLIVVFSTLACPFCREAKRILDSVSCSYLEINLHEYPSLWKVMKERSGGKSTVPQIFFAKEHIGGCQELIRLVERQTLEERVAEAVMVDDEGYWRALEDALAPREAAGGLPTGASFVGGHGITKELEEVYESVRKGLSVGVRRQGLRFATKAFQGKELVGWLMRDLDMPESSGRAVAQKLYDLQFFALALSGACATDECLFSDEALYKWFADTVVALNVTTEWAGEVRPAMEVVGEIRQLLLDMECRYIDASGKAVNYDAIGASAEFRDYQLCAMELQKVDLTSLSESGRIAFFINTYNILMIHGSIVYGAPSSALERKSFFSKVAYLIAGHRFTLNDIEHGILRANRKPPGALFRCLSASDERLKYCLKNVDPRIHFVLNCGAKSCPAIKILSSENLEGALQAAAEGFCDEEVYLDQYAGQVRMSMIFKWYASDFSDSGTHGVLCYAANFMPPVKATAVRGLVKQHEEQGSTVPVTYKAYDWARNSTLEVYAEEPIHEGSFL